MSSIKKFYLITGQLNMDTLGLLEFKTLNTAHAACTVIKLTNLPILGYKVRKNYSKVILREKVIYIIILKRFSHLK